MAARAKKNTEACEIAKDSMMFSLEYLARNGTLSLLKQDGFLLWTDKRPLEAREAYRERYFTILNVTLAGSSVDPKLIEAKAIKQGLLFIVNFGTKDKKRKIEVTAENLPEIDVYLYLDKEPGDLWKEKQKFVFILPKPYEIGFESLCLLKSMIKPLSMEDQLAAANDAAIRVFAKLNG